MADDAPQSLEAFRHHREELNAAILAGDNLTVKRFFALDTRAYEDGALPARTKELLGLVASLVLRCDDCITYRSGRPDLTRPLPALNLVVAVWRTHLQLVSC